jgi:hypothetical protein
VIVGGVLAYALICFAVLLTSEARALITATICIVTASLFGVVAFKDLRRLRDRVAINDDGVWYLRYGGATTFLRWDDDASLDPYEGRFGGRLVISDAKGL